MNDLITKWFGSSWRTTFGGILVGVPPLIAGALMTANIPTGKWAAFAMTLSLGLGGLILGTNSKDRQVSSTMEQVQQATAKEAATAKPPEALKP